MMGEDATIHLRMRNFLATDREENKGQADRGSDPKACGLGKTAKLVSGFWEHKQEVRQPGVRWVAERLC